MDMVSILGEKGNDGGLRRSLRGNFQDNDSQNLKHSELWERKKKKSRINLTSISGSGVKDLFVIYCHQSMLQSVTDY